jgi:hypothetical protein
MPVYVYGNITLDMFSDETPRLAQGWGLTTKNQQANHKGLGLLHADQSSVDRQSLTTLGQGGDGQSITWPCRPKEFVEGRMDMLD